MVSQIHVGHESTLESLEKHCREGDDVLVYYRDDPQWNRLAELIDGVIDGSLAYCRVIAIGSQGVMTMDKDYQVAFYPWVNLIRV